MSTSSSSVKKPLFLHSYHKKAQEFVDAESIKAWIADFHRINEVHRIHEETPIVYPEQPGCYIYEELKNPWLVPISCDFLTPAGSEHECHDYEKTVTGDKELFFWNQDKTIDGIRRRITFLGPDIHRPVGSVIYQYIVPEKAVEDQEEAAPVRQEEAPARHEEVQEEIVEIREDVMRDEDDDDVQEPIVIISNDDPMEERPLQDQEEGQTPQLPESPIASNSTAAQAEGSSGTNEDESSVRRSSRPRKTTRKWEDGLLDSSRTISKPSSSQAPPPSTSSPAPATPKTTWQCKKCAVHGVTAPFKGHTNCPWLTCKCPPCEDIDTLRRTKNESRLRNNQKKGF